LTIDLRFGSRPTLQNGSYRRRSSRRPKTQEPIVKLTLITTLCLAAGLAAVQAAPASAEQPTPTVYSTTIKLSGIDLSGEDGARVALQRITTGSNLVCSRAAGGYSPLVASTRSYKACVRNARSRAVSELDNPTVTALYHGGRPVEVARN
jgi:UrcA family protein